MSWRDAGPDPSRPENLERRSQVLASSFRLDQRDRLDVLAELCQGRSVLDVGCVAHDPARRSDPRWLHRVIVEASARCVGLDVDAEGVAALRHAGFDVVVGDVGRAGEAVGDRAPFDVVVAGEVIEHLGCVDGIFEGAAQVLTSDGRLVLTTPNPYAPWRVRAGQQGVVWENADHVSYLFPSGIAELADRHGFALEWWCTLQLPFTSSLRRSAKVQGAALLARARGRRPDPATGLRLPLRLQHLSPLDHLLSRWRRSQGRLGETAVYVLTPLAQRHRTRDRSSG